MNADLELALQKQVEIISLIDTPYWNNGRKEEIRLRAVVAHSRITRFLEQLNKANSLSSREPTSPLPSPYNPNKTPGDVGHVS